MNQFSMLLINNNRSKAYLQTLCSNNLIPDFVLVLNDKNVVLPEHTLNDQIKNNKENQKFLRSSQDIGISFDEKEHILITLKKFNITYEIVDSLDINSEEVIKQVKTHCNKKIVYSGPGGTILRKEILSLGKKFIHVHPGILPEFRGSTTLYYSLLLSNKIGASVIYLEEGIDEGEILHKVEYTINEKSVDLDYVLDPIVRAKTLLNYFVKDKSLSEKQNPDSGNTFYIIHPFLKHCTLEKVKADD